jgi:hypothetical protein
MHRLPIALSVVLLVLASGSQAEIIDRILAVVEGQLITLSDVRAVTRLGLEAVPQGEDPLRGILDRLIERHLMLVEVERYAPPEPSPEAIDAGLAAVRARFPDALAFETTLHQVGMTAEHLRRYTRDALRIEAYLQQRFTATIQPSEDEIAGYYRLHAEDFTRGGALTPFEAVRQEVRARLIDERRRALVEEWLAGLRRRADVVDLYLAQPSIGTQDLPTTNSEFGVV